MNFTGPDGGLTNGSKDSMNQVWMGYKTNKGLVDHLKYQKMLLLK
jgi:hypothetical protein